MKKISLILLTAFFCANALNAKSDSANVVLITPTGKIFGSYMVPKTARKIPVPVVLIIPGSGPTDRNGNNQFLVNDTYLAISDSLAKHGIATLRYDKRGIGASKAAGPDEANLRFEMYVQDAEDWIKLLHKDKRFSKIFVLGHSEGALIGSIAVQHQLTAGFLSVEGAGIAGDSIVMQQLQAIGKMPASLMDTAAMYFSFLRSGRELQGVPRNLFPIFRPSVQAYIASWIKYSPASEIAKVTVPICIIQGTHDLQVDTAQYGMLRHAAPGAEGNIIDGMNHILRMAPMDRIKNLETYSDSSLPVAQAAISVIIQFVMQTRKEK